MSRKRAGPLALLVMLTACGPQGADPAQEAKASTRIPAQFQHLASGPTASGERLTRVLGCRGCHGQDLQGQDWFEDPSLGTLYASNLTRAVPNYDDASLARAIQGGVRADGTPLWDMPSHIFSHLSPADVGALIAYLRTIRPAGVVHPPMALTEKGRRTAAEVGFRAEPEKVRERQGLNPPSIGGDHDWARYMIRATCSECHGVELKGDPNPTAESTAPPLTIVSAYSRAQFHHLLRSGEPVGGRTLGLMGMVARSRFSQLSDAEVDAIYDYLSALAARPQ